MNDRSFALIDLYTIVLNKRENNFIHTCVNVNKSKEKQTIGGMIIEKTKRKKKS
jgi:hypothetical protein